MELPGIHLAPRFAPEGEALSGLREGVLIAGFDGWGNALGMAQALLDHLMQIFPTESIARLDSDHYYRYDQNRPQVDIQDGRLLRLEPPGGTFYLVTPPPGSRPLVLLKAHEPDLRWWEFARALTDFALSLNITTLITLGSLYDRVLHTERVISGVVSDTAMGHGLQAADIGLINYQGPSAVHTAIHAEALKQGIDAMSLWCHCPHYLQGSVHFGLLARLGTFLARMGRFDFDTTELESNSRELDRQLQTLIDKNPKLAAAIEELKQMRDADPQVPFREPKSTDKQKVIDITQFLAPK